MLQNRDKLCSEKFQFLVLPFNFSFLIFRKEQFAENMQERFSTLTRSCVL